MKSGKTTATKTRSVQILRGLTHARVIEGIQEMEQFVQVTERETEGDGDNPLSFLFFLPFSFPSFPPSFPFPLSFTPLSFHCILIELLLPFSNEDICETKEEKKGAKREREGAGWNREGLERGEN